MKDNDIAKSNLKNERFDTDIANLYRKYHTSIYSNYLYFSFENKITKQRLVFNTDHHWYKHYIGEKLIDHCPLYFATRQFCRQSRQGTSHFWWHQIIPEGKKQREVVCLRKEHGIANGVTLSHQTNGHLIILGLGTAPKDNELQAKYELVLPKIITLFTEASHVCFSQFNNI